MNSYFLLILLWSWLLLKVSINLLPGRKFEQHSFDDFDSMTMKRFDELNIAFGSCISVASKEKQQHWAYEDSLIHSIVKWYFSISFGSSPFIESNDRQYIYTFLFVFSFFLLFFFWVDTSSPQKYIWI